MNPYDTYGSPTDERPPSRYREEEPYERTDTYRRCSPRKMENPKNFAALLTHLLAPNERRRPPPRDRSRSPIAIDRYQPGDRGDRGPRERNGRDDYFNDARPPPTRERDDRRRAPSPVAANIDRYVPGQDAAKPAVSINPLAILSHLIHKLVSASLLTGGDGRIKSKRRRKEHALVADGPRTA